MPRKLRYTKEAIADLEAARGWQTQPGSGAAGIRRVQAIRAAIRRLKTMPCLHARGERPGTRELSVEGHRIVYAVNPDTNRNDTAGDVLVLAVFGPGQDRSTL